MQLYLIRSIAKIKKKLFNKTILFRRLNIRRVEGDKRETILRELYIYVTVSSCQ